MRFSPTQKKQIVQTARLIVKRVWPELTFEATCLQSCIVMHDLLRRAGVRSVLQSGNVSWRCGEQTVFDGNHFGYHYTPPKSRDASPEFHAWLGIVETQEIVDITTGFQPEQMRRLLGGTWRADLLPPDFVWSSQAESPYLQANAYYEPTLEGTAFVVYAAQREAEGVRAGSGILALKSHENV